MLNLKRVVERARSACRKAKRCVAQLLRRLVTEPGYADALANLAVAVVPLICVRPSVVRFVREVAQAFAVLIRTLIRNQNGHELGWSDLDPGWE